MKPRLFTDEESSGCCQPVLFHTRALSVFTAGQRTLPLPLKGKETERRRSTDSTAIFFADINIQENP